MSEKSTENTELNFGSLAQRTLFTNANEPCALTGQAPKHENYDINNTTMRNGV